jgi:hypothetical protein
MRRASCDCSRPAHAARNNPSLTPAHLPATLDTGLQFTRKQIVNVLAPELAASDEFLLQPCSRPLAPGLGRDPNSTGYLLTSSQASSSGASPSPRLQGRAPAAASQMSDTDEDAFSWARRQQPGASPSGRGAAGKNSNPKWLPLFRPPEELDQVGLGQHAPPTQSDRIASRARSPQDASATASPAPCKPCKPLQASRSPCKPLARERVAHVTAFDILGAGHDHRRGRHGGVPAARRAGLGRAARVPGCGGSKPYSRLPYHCKRLFVLPHPYSRIRTLAVAGSEPARRVAGRVRLTASAVRERSGAPPVCPDPCSFGAPCVRVATCVCVSCHLRQDAAVGREPQHRRALAGP